jgi:hypothetical protein
MPGIAITLTYRIRVFTRKEFGELAGGFAARKLPKIFCSPALGRGLGLVLRARPEGGWGVLGISYLVKAL